MAADLAEEFTLKLGEVGPRRTRVWYWRQVVASIVVRRWLIWRGRQGRAGQALSRAKIASDVRSAWRSLRLRSGSSAAIIAVVGLGIGLVTTMFAITDPFLFRPLPFRAAHELVTIRVTGEGLTPEARIPTLDEWRSRTALFQGIAGMRGGERLRLRLPDGAVLFTTAVVTEDYFSVLGLDMPVGPRWQAATAEDVQMALLTPAGAARLREHRSAGVLATDTARMLRVVGTLPEAARIRFGSTHALIAGAVDKVIDASWAADGSSWSFRQHFLLARLQPGITPESVVQALAVPLPSGRRLDVRVERLTESVGTAERPLALGGLAAGALVLLVCAGNLGNLFIARQTHRAREFATRAAIGASRGDLVRLWIIELCFLVGAALATGLVVARLALPLVVSVLPAQYARLGEPSLSIRVTVFAALAALVVVVIGVVPATLVSRWMLRRRAATPAISAGRRVTTLRFVFGAVQAAVAMILAIGAAMLVYSYVNLMRQDVGFDERATSVRVSYPSGSAPAIAGNIAASIARLRAIPGVQSASATTRLVMDREVGGAITVGGQQAFAHFTEVWPDFFDAAGMTILQGRALAASDDRGRGVVVNEAFARKHWPGAAPVVGEVVQRGGQQAEIAGVVRDGLDGGLTAVPQPTLYTLADSIRPRATGTDVVYVLRDVEGAGVPAASIRRAIAGVNPDAVIEEGRTIGARFAESIRTRTFATLMLVCFCITSAAIGLAGLVSIVGFMVTRQTRELAIRVALGASRGHIRLLVAREALLAATTGGVAGLLVGQWLSRWLESFVYGIEAGSWTTPLAAAGVMLAAMVTAALVAARRALAVQPTTALRID